MIAVDCAASRPPSDPAMSLTSRERDVIDYVRLGYRNHEIALAMDTSPNTVRNQLAAIYQKLGAANRAEAVWLAGAF
jgi:DNA-binding NarL/FixJ family response regulator